ncbi:MAG: hypothetical protein E7370_00150 [Clostridiales bacterium]|nr:hypothetical protein [Clostridiales bacterium]
MKSKTKIMTIAAASLACIAVAGVGFASWVITGAGTDNVNGNLTVETVDNQYVGVEAGEISGDVAFTVAGGAGWLRGESTAESLNPSFTLQGTNVAKMANVKITIAASDSEKWATATGSATGSDNADDYVLDFSEMTISYKVGDGNATTVNYETDGWVIPASAFASSDATVLTVTINFGWGQAFIPQGQSAGVNPATYYSSQTQTSALVAEADARLTALYNALNGVSYTVTCTPVATSANA